MNAIARQIAQVAREHLLRPKWLIAPSRRIAHQWILQAVQAAGLVNLHVRTMSAMALELAAPAMAARGLTLLSARAGALLVDQVLERLRKEGPGGYLLQLEPSLTLSASLFQSLQSIRQAGLGVDDLKRGQFESPAKGGELVRILELYLQELAARKRIDYAGVLGSAVAECRHTPRKAGSVPISPLLMVPSDMEFCTLERRLLEAMPPDHIVRLAADEPAQPRSGEPAADAGLLSWVNKPAEAPSASGDGTATIFHAIGEVNEVRHVLRTCLEQGVPLDDVEILYTDAQTYLPLIYELTQGLIDSDASPQPDRDALATFVEGIPVRYSRPGRALAAWLAWLRQDCPQATLVRMVQDGLLAAEEGDDKPGFVRLASLLRSVPIGFGRDRYAKRVQDQIRACQEESKSPTLADEDGQPDPTAVDRTRRRLDGLQCLGRLLADVLRHCPKPDATQKDVLQVAAGFVKESARAANYLDYLSRDRLSEDIEEMAALVSDEPAAGLDAWEFLEDLVHQARVGGSSSRPGCLHAASIANGGHTGRGHTFIVGLNDDRFPGAGLQDPVLLDAERERLSPGLKTAAQDLHERVEGFARLLARLRGKVTLSFCSHDLVDDRETFASPVVVSAYRILTGNRQGDQTRLMKWLPPPVSFVPERPEQALTGSEWWMFRTTGPQATAKVRQDAVARFAHLARGNHAAQQRASALFTEHDGRVEDAAQKTETTKVTKGTMNSPESPPFATFVPSVARRGEQVHAVSPSALEMLGHCPLRYFFRHVLHLRKPEELEIDTTQWLDALHNGLLLHEVFCAFMRERAAEGKAPVFQRDNGRLTQILQGRIDLYRRTNPPPSEGAFQRRCQELRQACNIFLREEEEYGRGHTPQFMEVTIGLGDYKGVTKMDSPDPIAVGLGGGKSIRVWGRLDRVDRVNGPGNEFVVWDYKTGGSWSYRQSPPFNQGRVLQHFLYMEIAAARLRELYGSARMRASGYFLPGHRGAGERFGYSPEELEPGRAIVADLCRLAGSGTFLSTDNAGDCLFCDYQPICGDCEAVAQSAKLKTSDPVPLLDPYRRLRCPDETE